MGQFTLMYNKLILEFFKWPALILVIGMHLFMIVSYSIDLQFAIKVYWLLVFLGLAFIFPIALYFKLKKMNKEREEQEDDR